MRQILWVLLVYAISIGSLEAAASRSFDGANDNISMGDVLDEGVSSFTICAWVKLTEDATNDLIIGKSGNLGDDGGYKLYQNASDFPVMHVEDESSACAVGSDCDCQAIGSTDIDGAWHFICGTFEGSTTDRCRIFVDGVLETTNSGDDIGTVNNTENFQLGEAAGSGDLSGLVAHAMMFTEFMNAADQAQFMFFPESYPVNRTGYWPLWGGSPEDDLDDVPHDGTVTGATTSEDGPPISMSAEGN